MAISAELGDPHEVRLDGGVIRYREAGKGKPVVFVHGLLVNGDLWRRVVPGISKTHRCITPDLPLGAHSRAMDPGADLTIGGVAKVLADFLEALDLSDVTLVANDTGGAVTQVMITRYPERVGKVVLTPCDAFDNFLPPIFRPLQWAARIPWLLRLATTPLRVAALQRLPFAFGWLSKRPIPQAIVDSYLANFFDEPGVFEDAVRVIADISPHYTNEAAGKLGGFHGPVLLVWASEDKLFPPRDADRLAAAFANARVARLDDCFTFVPEDRPDALVQEISAFLSEAG